MKKRIALLAAGLVMVFLALPGRAAEVMVFAAASLTDSLKAAATDYEKQSGDKISFNFGASSLLARQIAEGAPADIFFSADEAKMDGLERQGLIDSGTRQSRLGNTLVVVIAADSRLQVRSAGELTNSAIAQMALADPATVPAGIYARKWLQKAGLWPALESRVIPMENVRAALAAVASGNVGAGVVYKTDAGISPKVKIAFEVPAQDAPEISYPMAMVKAAAQPAAAKKFLQFLGSDEAGKIFERFGFILRHPAPR